MKRTIFTTILNISNINIPEEFGLSSELFLFDNPDNYMQMDQNMVAVNEPFTTTQGDHVAETNYMTNDSTEDILPPEYKRYKGQVSHGRIKSSIEGNKRNTALSDN
ncbi:unnamed protein product [Rhizophagus irregularis]|nr:unnamed protein product [Rhizophagus irregularis]